MHRPTPFALAPFALAPLALAPLALALVTALATPAIADDLPPQLPFVTAGGYGPFSDPALPEGGLATELVRKAYAATGITATVDFSTWELAYDAMLSVTYAGTFPYRRTPEREAAALYSDPIFVVLQQAYSHPDRPIRYTGPESFAGLRMCLPQGWAAIEALVPLVDAGDLALVTPLQATDCPRLILAGRADFTVLNNFVAPHVIEAAGYRMSGFHHDQAAIGIATHHLLVSTGLPNGQAIIDRFNLGLQKLRESGDYDRIMAKHVAGGT